MGRSGAGKSSLLRAIAGLWDRGAGVIARPPRKRLIFVPQRPYCTIDSLRKQILYPLPPEAAARVTEAELLGAPDPNPSPDPSTDPSPDPKLYPNLYPDPDPNLHPNPNPDPAPNPNPNPNPNPSH